MDASYSFEIVPVLITDEMVAAQAGQTAGLDLYLDASHDLEVQSYDLRLVAGANEVAQHLLVGLRLFAGEWYLDEEAGMPYYRDVFVNAPKTRVVETVFRQAILGDPDVERIRDFSLELDLATRKLDVSFIAVSSTGVVEVEAVLP